jgi:hypothetical protein
VKHRSRTLPPNLEGKGPDDTISLAQLVALVAVNCVSPQLDITTRYNRARAQVYDALNRTRVLSPAVAGRFTLGASVKAFPELRSAGVPGYPSTAEGGAVLPHLEATGEGYAHAGSLAEANTTILTLRAQVRVLTQRVALAEALGQDAMKWRNWNDGKRKKRPRGAV